MVIYQQKHRDCAGTGCRWCNGLGYLTGNGEAGALRGQLHSVQGLTGRATIVPEELFKFVTKPKGPNRKGRGRSPEADPNAYFDTVRPGVT